MPIDARCGGCQKAVRVSDALGGKRVRCAFCQEIFRIPQASSPARQLEAAREPVGAGDEVAFAEPEPKPRPKGRSRPPMPETEQVSGTPKAGRGAAKTDLATKKRPRRDEDEAEDDRDAAPKKKGGKAKVFLFGCLGVLLLGGVGLGGTWWWFIGRPQGVDERLVGSWVLDPGMTLLVNAQLKSTFPSEMRDIRYDFRQDGTCTLFAAKASRPGKWDKVKVQEKAVRIRFKPDAGGDTEYYDFSYLNKDGIAIEKGAPMCVLKRAAGAAPTPAPANPDAGAAPSAEEVAKFNRLLAGRWFDKDGKLAWEFDANGSGMQHQNGTRKVTYKMTGDGGVKIDVAHPNPGVRPGVAYTLDYKAKPEQNTLLFINRPNNFEMRFVRDNGTSMPKNTPPPKVVEIDSPRHNISRSDTVKTMNLTGDGKIVAWTEAGLPQMLRVWDVSGSSVDVKLKPELPEGQSFEAVAFTPTGKVVAAGLNDGTIRRFAIGKAGQSPPWKAHDKAVTGIVYVTGKPLVVTASADGTIKSWNPSSLMKPTATITAHGPVQVLTASPDGRYAFSLADAGPQLWDLQTGAEIKATLPRGIQKAAAFSPDGATLAIAGDSSVTLFDVGTWKRRSALLGHTKLVTSLSFDGSGKRLATGSDDTTVRIWDVTTGHPLVVAKRHSAGVTCVALSGNGRVLASGGSDKSVYIWNVPGPRRR